MKIVGAVRPATSTAITAIVARITIRNDTANGAIAVAIATTIRVMMMMMSYMSMTGEERENGGAVGHGIGLDHDRHDQKENIISVIGHTAQLDLPHLQPQSATGTIAL